MNRADRRRMARERSQRLRLNSPAPDGGVAPRKQHGRALFVVNAETGVVLRELGRDTYPSSQAACAHVWPDVAQFVTTVGVSPDFAIASWATGVPAALAPAGGYGPTVVVEGWCEHIREGAAHDLGLTESPDGDQLADLFAANPDAWLVLGHMPAAPLLS
jgi:hypothetical protein